MFIQNLLSIFDYYFKKIKIHKIDIIYFCFFLILVMAVFWKFIFTHGDIISHGDIAAFYGNAHRLPELTKYLFNDYGSTSNMEVFNTVFLVKPILFILKIVHLYSDINLWKFSTIFYVVISYISIYYFLIWLIVVKGKQNINKYRLPIFLASIFFVFSPYILNVYPAGGFWMSYAITPMFIVLVFKFFEEEFSVSKLILTSFVISLLVVGTQYLFFSLFIALLIFIFTSIERIYHKTFFNKKYLLSIVIKFFSLSLIVLLLNMHFILTSLCIYINGGSITPGYNVTTSMVSMLSSNASLLRTLVSSDSWVRVNEHISNFLKTYDPITLAFRYLLVFLSFWGVFFCNKLKKLKNIYFLIIIVIFIIFYSFSIGPRNPFYYWLIFNSPIKQIGWIFRSSSKLTYFFWLFYSIGFVYFLEFIFSKLKHLITKIGFTCLIVIIIFIPIGNQLYSLFNFYFLPTKLPDAYKELFLNLENIPNENQYKVLFLAPYSYGFNKNTIGFEDSFVWNGNKMISSVIQQSSPVPAIGYWHMTVRDWQDGLYQKIYPEFTETDPNNYIPSDIGKNYLGPANVKYLVYQNDIVMAQDKGSEAINILLKRTDLRFIQKFGDSLYLFENLYVKPIIYDTSGTNINIVKVNPTEYKFSGVVDSSSTIFFAQTFDPFWQLKIDNKIIKPEKTFSLNLIKYQIGKSGYVEGDINYFPQKYYDIGMKIFEVTLIICLGYLGYDFVKRRKKKKEKIIDIKQNEITN